jgi:hypothetical protein
MRRPGIWLLIACAAAAGPPPAAAAPGTNFPYAVKAGFLYSLTRYVEWPARAFPSPRDPFVIAVIGADASERAAISAVLRGHTTAADRAISLVFLDPGEPLPASCQMAYVLTSARLSRAQLGQLADHRPLLLVGESEGFAEHGGVVNFITVDGHARLQVNPGRAEELGLRLRSPLASVAQLVHDK